MRASESLKLKAFVVHFKRFGSTHGPLSQSDCSCVLAHFFWDIPNLLCDLPYENSKGIFERRCSEVMKKSRPGGSGERPSTYIPCC